ncbi:MAG: tetratricopeptide repeat protein [Acidobacteriia bacterium]|nr:tetratricopeptide repeat protein [Terriglobia bacterium]MYG04907.1 tetratricopeptide repeat protein [Terriglobia bacterium]MYK11342.1 tetratricopeptide repeat protein [Terriglobia bacterium]
MAATGSVLVLAAATAFLSQSLAAQLAKDPTGIAPDPTAEILVPPEPEMTAYISGSVQMSNGGVVPKETVIELVCGGFTRATDQVGPEGAFDIELSGRGNGLVDATQVTVSGRALGVPQPNHLGVVNMTNCVVRAELPGYQSSEIQLGIRSMFDSPDVGEVVLSKAEGILGHAISPSIARAPKKAVQSYEWALKQVGKPQPNLRKIAARLESAVRLDPSFAAAWRLLGQVREGLGMPEDALDAYKQAVAGDPHLHPVYTRIVPLLVGSGDLAGAIEMGERALEINRHLDDVRFYVAGAYLRSGNNGQCIEKSLELIERGATATYPQAHQFLGSAYANNSEFESSATHFRRFLELSPNATAADAIRNQLDEWSKLGVIAPASEAR